jgi:hypothetical protein
MQGESRMGVTRRDPRKKIKDTNPGVFAGQVVGVLSPGNLGTGTPGPTTVLMGDNTWVSITTLLTQIGVNKRYEPVISLGDPEDPANPQFVFAENGDIVMGGIDIL